MEGIKIFYGRPHSVQLDTNKWITENENIDVVQISTCQLCNYEICITIHFSGEPNPTEIL